MKFRLTFYTVNPNKSHDENIKFLADYESIEGMLANYKSFFTEDYPIEYWALKPEWAILESIEKENGAVLAINRMESIAPNNFKELLGDLMPKEIGPHIMQVEVLYE